MSFKIKIDFMNHMLEKKSNIMKFTLVLPYLLTSVFAQNFSAPLVLEAYSGKWYQAYSGLFAQKTFEKGAKCIKSFYDIGEEDILEVYNEQIAANTKIESIRGYAYTPNFSEPRKLKVVLDGQKEADYWIYEVGPIVDGEYQYSIVSDSFRLSLFVLVRNINDFFLEYNEKVLESLTNMDFTRLWNAPLPTIQDCY